MHAEMIGLHHHREPVGLDHVHQQLGDLGDRFLLDLWSRQDPFGQPGVLGQADQIGMLVRHSANPQPPHDRAEMVAARAANGDRPDNHQFVQARHVGEFGHWRRGAVAPLEHLVQVHLRHPACGVLRVVVVVDVDHEAFEDATHLSRNLIEQQVKFPRLDEAGDVVIGTESPVGVLKPVADAVGHGAVHR